MALIRQIPYSDIVFLAHFTGGGIDGEEIVEIDVINNIYKVGGEDLLAERRQNLGL